MMAKEKMSAEKKMKLVYSGEILLFAVIFIVMATLEITGVVGKREIMMIIFNWVTLFGGAWLIADFIWLLFSKKRRERNALIDKILVVPAGIYLITFDILCLSQQPFVTMEFRRLMMAIVFYYFGAVYIFQAIYHWFKPIPGLLAALEEDKQQEEQPIENKEAEQPVEENNEEEKKADE